MTTYAGLYGPEALIDSSGRAITSAVIDVFTHGTTTHVSLYQDNARGTPLSNPVPNGVDGSTAGRGLDSYGNLSFYVDPGRYDLRIATGAGTRIVEIEVETDPAESAASGVTGGTIVISDTRPTSPAIGTVRIGADVPGVPTSLAATPGDSQVVLTWTAPASNGGSAITDYLVEYKATSSGTWLTFADTVTATTGATVTGLTNSTPYDFRVSAINGVGTGSPSSTASATPATSVFASDDFNRADSASTLGTTSVGSKTWIAAVGTWGISTNTAYNPTGGNSYAVVDRTTTDMDVTITLSTLNAGSVPGVVARYTDGSNYLRLIVIGSTQVRIDQDLAGSVTTLDSGGATTVATMGDGTTLRLKVTGSQVDAWVNGVHTHVALTTGLATGTKAGMFVSSAGSTQRFDNFSLS